MLSNNSSNRSARAARSVFMRAASFTLLLAVSEASAVHAELRIKYTVEPKPPTPNAAAMLRVNLHIGGLAGDKSVKLQMPVWSPGDYHVQNFAQYVKSIKATTGPDHPADISHPDANTREVTTADSEAVDVSYEVPNEP